MQVKIRIIAHPVRRAKVLIYNHIIHYQHYLFSNNTWLQYQNQQLTQHLFQKLVWIPIHTLFDQAIKLIINNNRMNRITEDFKKNLISRYSQKEEVTEPTTLNTQPKLIPNSQHKFMQLFETINKPMQNHNPSPVKTANNQGKFAQTLKEYSNNPSFIESVVQTGEDALSLSYEVLHLVQPPLILNHKMPFEDSIKDITIAFDGLDYRVDTELINDHFMDLDAFSTILSSLGRKNRVAEVKSQAKGKSIIRQPSIVPTPPVKQLHQIQTDTVELEQQHREESDRMKKIDLILMELIQEKKRKNYVVDYAASMEMKLMELLEYILQDELEYVGLDPSSKTRLVLRNLETFQGKTIEGQSKINLLRIFFEEFTALKKEKQEFNTPMKKLQNKEKVATKTRPQTKKTAKQQLYSQQNSHTEKRSIKSKATNSEKQKRDEWMGSLS